MATGTFDLSATIPVNFAARAAREPDRPAIAGTARPLTYGELAALAVRYADGLPEPTEYGARAAILFDHDGPQLAAMLAVLMRGFALVTLRPEDPPGWIRQIARTTSPEVVLCSTEHGALALDVAPGRVFQVGEGAPAAPGAPTAPVTAPRSAEEIAALICTSGSSGRPKVVIHSHANELDNARRYADGIGITDEDRIVWLAPLGSGNGLVSALAALVSGAALCPFSISRRGVTGLADWLEDTRVTVFDAIPSVLRSFAQTVGERRISGVRIVRLAGEGAVGEDVATVGRLFGERCPVANVLGASETGIVAQALISPADGVGGSEPLRVGRVVDGVDVALLDDRDEPAALGEICPAHDHLALGYWDDGVLESRRFVTIDGRRRWRSGDLGRWVSDGELEVVGRIDSQVKVRGQQLQVEAVEAALRTIVGVAAAAVGLASGADGEPVLTAYVVAESGRFLAPSMLRAVVAETLPAHAVPQAFEMRDQLPLTAAGKLDRSALSGHRPLPPTAHPPVDPPPVDLPTDPHPAESSSSGAAPSDVEQVLQALWSRALRREVGRHDPFLEFGGDSLSAAVVAAGVHDALGVELDLRSFSSNPTIAALAALIERRRTAQDGPESLPALRPALRSGPLSSSQLRMWDPTELAGETRPRWHVVVPFAIRGPLVPDLLRAAVAEIVTRHELLRTTFAESDGRPLAIVRDQMEIGIEEQDLRGTADLEDAIEAITEAQVAVPFDLRTGPLLRFVLLRTGEQAHRLLRISHHLVSDALSWRTFFDELAEVYPALAAGRPSPLGDPPQLQYGDYVAWEQEWQHPAGPRWDAEVAFWQRRLTPPAPVASLPFARAEPVAESSAPGVLLWGIRDEDSVALDRLGRQSGATFFMSRLAVFSALLALETEAEELVIGTPISTRIRAELQPMFGPMLNFVVLRLRLSGARTLRGWIGEVRRTVIDAAAHATVPWERLMPELRRRGVTIPPTDTRFVAWAALSTLRFGELELEPLPRRCADSWGFRLGVNRAFEANRCWVEFDPRVHDPALVRDFLTRLEALTAAVAAEPDRPLRDLHRTAGLV